MKNQVEWDRFLKGYWTKNNPKVPGVYPVKETQHGPTLFLQFVLEGGMVKPLVNWFGFIWSERMPELPQLPNGG